MTATRHRLGQVDGRLTLAERPEPGAMARVMIVDDHPIVRDVLKTYLSQKAVKTHVSHLLAKLGVRDRTQAAVMGVGGGGLR